MLHVIILLVILTALGLVFFLRRTLSRMSDTQDICQHDNVWLTFMVSDYQGICMEHITTWLQPKNVMDPGPLPQSLPAVDLHELDSTMELCTNQSSNTIGGRVMGL